MVSAVAIIGGIALLAIAVFAFPALVWKVQRPDRRPRSPDSPERKQAPMSDPVGRFFEILQNLPDERRFRDPDP